MHLGKLLWLVQISRRRPIDGRCDDARGFFATRVHTCIQQRQPTLDFHRSRSQLFGSASSDVPRDIKFFKTCHGDSSTQLPVRWRFTLYRADSRACNANPAVHAVGPDIHLAGKPLRLGRSELFAKLGVLRTELFRERFAKLLVFFLKL
jgi:hypothetical protein